MDKFKHSPAPWIQGAHAPWLKEAPLPAGMEYIASVRTSEGTKRIFAPCAHAEAWDGNLVMILAAPSMFDTLFAPATMLNFEESSDERILMQEMIRDTLKEAGWEKPATAAPSVCPCCGAPHRD